ncbi:hypothetical protein [Sulfurimonas sp.]|uniref:hypothetical protein n=1 Tax=Sulfurimonas sp. TaxID=2022749 RepID=UPI0025CEE522|nr:hypothetical protein [Sulfurimonas sp.]MBW6488516.1 hypothetical protein [Sulfurimonas sp.]
MSIGFDKLKSIGAQKIHEVTHIARAHVKSILEENFEEMNSVQLTGFISILEREYSVDLGNLREKAKEHFANNASSIKKEKSANVFLAHKKKKKLTTIYMILGVALIVLFFIFTATPSQDEASKVDDIAIESAKSALPMLDVEQNERVENENTTLMQEGLTPSEATVPDTSAKSLSFKIMPNTKVWLGYIDVAEQKRYQTTFSDELSLDPTKEWLLAFGHGDIMIEVNGVTTKFATPRNIRFSYKNSELKEISFEEFKSLNNGNIW